MAARPSPQVQHLQPPNRPGAVGTPTLARHRPPRPAPDRLLGSLSRAKVIEGADTTDRHDLSVDNPLLLTDRKSKRLANLLRRQSKVIKAKTRLLYFEPVVFWSSTSLKCKLQGLA